ncbi:hypothetical protein APR50_35485 [Variovorax paradoxus]|jgi:hypothetical protein|uniref:YciI family protein n=1 Tax=Variovorax paradoxus TaxID=34073 RepID=UPI0006E559A9|nr:hypothetical protein APR52_39870 [Variovorax paradoxus]KPU92913.1 hypothetical protein APR49_39680 [Variovorax paradoxus]KPU96920.1 hypothetical protein APR50_35485 [Variovorax paradoxus]KPV14839.1 hypothetical protein APR51_37115 [Variovorax paradoxus]KPV21283.1 hypothetical protein APR47_38945 [Variovorax paradoxus]
MKYLCLIYETEAPPPDMAHYIQEHIDYDAQLRARGQLVEAEALQPAETATTVRMRRGRLSVTDGPFAETSEQLGGFYLVEAGSEEEALRIAAGIPSARNGSIELRPILSFGPGPEGPR